MAKLYSRKKSTKNPKPVRKAIILVSQVSSSKLSSPTHFAHIDILFHPILSRPVHKSNEFKSYSKVICGLRAWRARGELSISSYKTLSTSTGSVSERKKEINYIGRQCHCIYSLRKRCSYKKCRDSFDKWMTRILCFSTSHPGLCLCVGRKFNLYAFCFP